MNNATPQAPSSGSVLFIPHGGGPLPLLRDPGHEVLVRFLEEIGPTLGTPEAILLISAHWEASVATLTSGKSPGLIYDYYGFPEPAYDIRYPAPGHPTLATQVHGLLTQSGMNAKLDPQRGFDHGMFVPLKILFPDARIPCVQLSLLKSLDPSAHLRMGKALAPLRQENILVIGSGLSFHNMHALMSPHSGIADPKNDAFERWLVDTCTNPALDSAEREERLIRWQKAPFARYCHPREEHLLPLHVCCGLADQVGQQVYHGTVMGKRASAFLWSTHPSTASGGR
ncbi:MAG: class III extradiol ring-cleavage dioxygenase [Pseudomonadota bacterium]|nr:class III extradiol ring-cleavage dioxygenase [Pseudomonadota bacterium]